MRLGRRLYTVLDVFRKTTIVVLFSFVIVTGFTEVICRYAFLKSLGWTEEILRYLNVWIILLGASVAVPWNAHLSVTFLLRFLPPPLARRVTRAVLIGILCFLAVFVYVGTLKTIRNIPHQILAFPISIAWFYLAIPVASLFMAIDYALILLCEKHPFVSREEDRT